MCSIASVSTGHGKAMTWPAVTTLPSATEPNSSRDSSSLATANDASPLASLNRIVASAPAVAASAVSTYPS